MGWWRDLGRKLTGQPRPGERRAEFGSSEIPGPMTPQSFGSVSAGGDSSLQAAAVWSATNLISRVVSSLPLDTFQRTDGAPKPVPNPALVQDPGGEDYGVEDWLYQYMMAMLLRGNVNGRFGAADKTTGYPAQIVLYHPDEVYGWRDLQGVRRWRVAGRPIPDEQMWHRRAYPVPGAVMGMSPVERQLLTVGVNIAAARFGMQYFTDGGHPTQVLRNTEETPSQAQAALVKARWVAAVHGSREPVVIGKAWEVLNPVQLRPDEAQMLQTLEYSSADCCRIWGPGLAEVLGYETGGSLTYSTRVDRATDLLTFTFDPWLTSIEKTLSKLLPRPRYVKFNRSALLRMTTMERWKVYAMQLHNHARVVNEVRADEDWPPVPWGDEPRSTSPPPTDVDDLAAKLKEQP